MMRFATVQVALILGAGLVSAQSISSKCQTAFQNILSSTDAQCLNPSALISIALQSSNSSIIDPINTWLVGLCSQPACNNDTLAAVTTNITTGCSAELSAIGFQTSDTSSLISVVQEVYPVARQIVCLKDTSANELCITESLTGIQNSFGTLSLSGIRTFGQDIVSSSTTIPTNVTCSSCTKATYNILEKNFPQYANAATSNLTTECGSSFVDGSDPSGISQTASTAVTSSSSTRSGAAPLFSINKFIAGAMSALLIVSSAFVILA
jgi:hypothetical protein